MHCTISQFAVAKHDSFDSTTAWRSKETDKEREYKMSKVQRLQKWAKKVHRKSKFWWKAESKYLYYHFHVVSLPI